MKYFSLIFLTFCVMSCCHKPAPVAENKEDYIKEDRIEKVILQFHTTVHFAHTMLFWDANLSEIIFKDISGGGMIIYDENLGDWVIGFRPKSTRFIVDSISADYIRDSLKLLPSDLNYVDNTIQDDGSDVDWMVIYESGALYEGNYIRATDNHGQLAGYLLDLLRVQHPDSLS